MSLTGVVTLASTGTVSFSCGYSPSGLSDQMAASERQIFATKIGSLHGQ
jgi:hypothetical protein